MDKLKQLYNELSNMKIDVQNISVRWSYKFEAIGEFVESGLEDAICVIDNALDRIQELEDELEEANERIDELERDLNEAV